MTYSCICDRDAYRTSALVDEICWSSSDRMVLEWVVQT